MKTLVIYDERPDRTRFFCLTDLGPSDLIMLHALQALILNYEEVTVAQAAEEELFLQKINGAEDRIPEWPVAFDTDNMEADVDARRRAFNQIIRDYTPDKIYWITFLL